MPPLQHAVFSASAAHRWLSCPPSAMLEKELPDETSVYAEEGTAAHEVAEYKVRTYLGEKNLTVPSTGNFDADDVLQVIDLKYGKGVAVSAEDNPQMKLYALGALNLYDYLYDIRTVKMAIVQPRLDSISEWEISVDALKEWTENTLRPISELAAKGEGEFKAGEHCRFCKLKATCRKRAEKMLEMAKYDFVPPAELNDEEVAAVLAIASELAKWADDVFAYAQAQAINNGVHWDGYKIVEGRSNRKFTDEKKVADICREQGYQLSQIYKTTLIGITDMEKLMGKKQFRELLGEYVHKPKGKLTLVPVSDKREEISTINEFMVYDE